MVSIISNIYRGNFIESRHESIFVIKDISGKNLLSNSRNNIIYPRSAIKIFQALPFVNSEAKKIFNLNEKDIAISCSSHSGEKKHINVLKNWLKKINIKPKKLLCGIHNPLNEKSSNKLLLSGERPSQIHNNCSGKHLGIISGCLAKKININNYTFINHPYQKLIMKTLENFMESKIIKKNIGTDGCSLPQFAFPIENISLSMINLIREKDKSNEYSSSINTIINSIIKYPYLIGGNNKFDSEVIKVTKGRIFCKGGAEGVLLFADFKKKIGGAIKICDGNNRAIPSITMKIFSRLKIISKQEKNKLSSWENTLIFNHAKKNVGKIISVLKV